MAEQPESWPAAGAPPPGWLPPPGRTPTALSPGGPARPRYREPHPVGAGGLFAGLAAGAAWLALFGALGRDLNGYAWWTVIAAVTAWTVAVVLARIGDRGAAVGVAITAGIGWAIAAGYVAARWIDTNDWPMW